MLQCMLYPDSPSQSPAFTLVTMSPDAVMQREPAGTEDAVLKGEDFVVDGEQYEDTVADGRTCVDDDGDVFADDALLLSFKVRV